ncbi:hypothetical protein OH738_25820 [Streptomyces hirsutus]|uniref:Lipoprotein n=1 Tax=Streptomyces hirsutus TaxID=35620 RepID=A0ABZ1GN81_9ACTN|nr:hypothetical protein [Streptomyces hirsutus]WSD06752.1 hypothetical protein OIE73_13870 [Streptomyces hirsutus]WTD19840.1 hypothetical protein OH738_25820 [Streptomyces hirsutus]
MRSSLGAVCALAVLATALSAGCQSAPGGVDENGRPAGQRTVTVSPSPIRTSGYGAVFLGIDECSSFGRTSFTEVSCTGERAAARVVARHDGTVRDGPRCPATTDFVLHISEQRPASDEDGDGAVPRGYACMRNLQPPHPGDPGGGGGPRTIVGDCVRGLDDGQVRETACDGEGEQRPEYRVTEAVDARSRCPASTTLYVRLGGSSPVGCAGPV